jgi:hypothetical protein
VPRRYVSMYESRETESTERRRENLRFEFPRRKRGESVRTVKVGNSSVKIYRREAEQYQQKALLILDYCGSAYGSRTRVPALRGLCPNH